MDGGRSTAGDVSVYGDPSWLYGHTFASGTKDIREKIADALDRRTDEVVSSVLSAVINGAGGRPTDRVLDSQADYARQGTGLMARWIRTGRAASHEELADIGPIRREAASVTGQVTRMVRANLAFRDGVMAIVRDEVSRLGAPLELLLGLSAGVDFGFRLNLLQIGRVFDRRSQAYEDELAAKEAELAHQALHDPLTGLANRALMFDRLDQACERLRRHPARGGVGVIFIDLDDFKAVNDSHGHAAGDAVLAEAGRRLVATVRPEDTVARLGGDEFVVICESVPDEAWAQRAGGRLADELRHPVAIDGGTATLSASTGAAVGFPPECQAERLLRQADDNMYKAKRAAKRRAPRRRGALHAVAAEVPALP